MVAASPWALVVVAPLAYVAAICAKKIFNSKLVLGSPETASDANYAPILGYFHNWTGSRVTCRDWFQLSLKEGLTMFRDQEFSSVLEVVRLNALVMLQSFVYTSFHRLIGEDRELFTMEWRHMFQDAMIMIKSSKR